MRIGIDLGGTKTEVIALGDAGEQLYRHRLPTPRDDYRQTIETIATLVDMAEQATGQRHVIICQPQRQHHTTAICADGATEVKRYLPTCGT